MPFLSGALEMSMAPAERPRELPLVCLRSDAVDFEYLYRRHQEEIERAQEAETYKARDAHLALAHQYLAEMERLRAQEGPQLGLVTG